MLDFLDGAIDAVSSAVNDAVSAVTPSAPASAAEPAPQAAPAPAATDEHHDWVSSVFGVDPRQYAANTAGPDTTELDSAPPSSGGASAGAGGGDPAGEGAGGAGGGAAPTTQDDGVIDDVLHIFGAGKRAAREETVENAVKTLQGMKEEDIQKLGTDERLRLLHDLAANGDLTAQASGMQKRLYNNTPLDPAEQGVDDARSTAIAQAVAADKELQDAQANWATMSEGDKAAALKKIVEAQSKAMGVTAPEIVVEHGMKEAGMTVSGVYLPDGKLHLNMDSDSMTANFPQAVSIATHENTHHYQAELVKRLHDGTLVPGDPEYDAARLFEANNAKGGYVGPDAAGKSNFEQQQSMGNYKNQPVERHAWDNGSVTARKIDHALKQARGVPDLN